MAPAVHVAVIKHHQFEQSACVVERAANRFRCFPNGHAAKQRQRRCITPITQHRIDDGVVLHAVCFAGGVVFNAIGRCGVHDAGAGILGYVVAQIDRRQARIAGISG